MKTRQYTIAMLLALIFGTVTIQAQSTHRSPAQEKQERTQTTRTDTKKATPQKAMTTQPARQVREPQVQQQQRTTQPARQVREPQVQQQQRTTQPARQAQKPQVQQQQRTTQPARQVQEPRVQQNKNEQYRTASHTMKPVSISTQNNPRSTYRETNSTAYTDRNRTENNKGYNYSSKSYYGGNHYHNAYPTSHVNFHYHHDTYLNNYHVLYYPAHRNIYWDRNMYRDYRNWYPNYQWRYNYGYSIQTISAFDAKYNLGEVAMVYGRVYSTWHNQETDDYLLFFGGDYPSQQFTVVLSGHIARKFSWRPERYFLGEHLTITGLITTFDGNPEIIVKDKRQVGIY